MRYLTRLGILALLLLAGLFASVSAQPQERDLSREEPYLKQLKRIAPDQLQNFQNATAEMDKRNCYSAVDQFTQVLAKAPNFEPAMRRMSACLINLGQRDQGLALARRAVAIDRSADNLMTLATGLVGIFSLDHEPTDAELTEGSALAKEALEKNAEHDSYYAQMAARIALKRDDLNQLGRAVAILERDYPNEATTHFFKGILLAENRSFVQAEAEVHRAVSLGYPADEAQPLLTELQQQIHPQNSAPTSEGELGEYGFLKPYFAYFGSVVLIWVVGLLLLFGLGKYLSSKTLKFLENWDPQDPTGQHHVRLRKLYRVVIAAAAVYYYVSQPIVIAIVFLATVGVLIAMWIAHITFIKLMLFVAAIGLGSIYFMIRSLFIRPKLEDPGRQLDEAEAPGLWAMAGEVARQIETRPVSEIRITAGTELAVYERGGILQKLRDQGERVLIVGMGVLNDFDQNAFRAVLAHEYGHFSHRDTAGGETATRVNGRILSVAQNLVELDLAKPYNLAFQFLRVYHFLLRRITHGATRLQEVMADRVAVQHYGAAAFREGLTHVVRREIEFNYLANAALNASVQSKSPLKNLYQLEIEVDADKQSIDEAVKKMIERTTTEDDTHPSPADRFRFADRVHGRTLSRSTGQMWDLFSDREKLTAEIHRMLALRIGARI